MTTLPPVLNDLNALRAALGPAQPVRAVVWDGTPGFGKRRTTLRTHERILLALAPIMRRWLAPDIPFSAKRYAPELPVEVQRLRALHQAGWAVPEVLAADSHVFVTADAGRILEALLSEEPDSDVRLLWLLDAARDLAAFHRGGQWHGAAQIRNVVRMKDGRLGRIDFETALDTRLPLPLLQAFDATLFFTSLARTRDVAALPTIARAYLLEAPEAALVALRRGFPLLRRLARSRLVQRLAPKEAERLQAVASLRLS